MAGTGKLFLSLFISLLSTSNGLQCLSKDGSPVDWFVVYKLPELRHADPILHEGKGFYYMDASHPELVLSHTGMNSSDHAVYYTLQQIYKNKSDIAYVMYNDQPPDTNPNLKHGHTKGTVGFDNAGGFWLVHSTPEFPPLKKDGYTWLERSCIFGQTFLCVSMDYSVMDNLGHIFIYTYPKIYDFSIPEKFRGNNPVLSKVLIGPPEHIKSPPWYNITQIVSKGHNKFISFEKFTDFHADLYDDLIAMKMKENLLVETWRVHGASQDRLPSNCSVPYKVYNIDTLIFPDKKIHFKTSKDHSKWAVSESQGDWLCIGDINRQKTQFKRGGGQVCFQNHRAWKAFKQLVNSTEPC